MGWILIKLGVAPPNFICQSVCLSVCPAFTAYIAVTMGWILIKLGENFGILVQLIMLKFEHSAAKGNTTHSLTHSVHSAPSGA